MLFKNKFAEVNSFYTYFYENLFSKVNGPIYENRTFIICLWIHVCTCLLIF